MTYYDDLLKRVLKKIAKGLVSATALAALFAGGSNALTQEAAAEQGTSVKQPDKRLVLEMGTSIQKDVDNPDEMWHYSHSSHSSHSSHVSHRSHSSHTSHYSHYSSW